MYANLEKEHMRSIITEELRTKYEYTDVTGKTYAELLNRLARFRATEVDVTSDKEAWF